MRTGCEKHLGEKEAGACWSDSHMEHQERRLLGSKEETAASTACLCALEAVTVKKNKTTTTSHTGILKDNAK